MNKPALLLASLSLLPALSLTGAANAYEAGDIIVRLGPTMVAPNDDSSTVAAIPDSGVAIDDNTQLGLTLSYMLNQNWGVELLAATPFEHDITGDGSLPSSLDVGSLKHLPPTLALVYYPLDSQSAIQPYIGAGLNYTYIYDTKANGEVEAALNGGNRIGLDIDNSFGLALRAGVDYKLNDKWSVNAGLWYIDIDTKATLHLAPDTQVNVDVEVDPFVYMLGVSYAF